MQGQFIWNKQHKGFMLGVYGSLCTKNRSVASARYQVEGEANKDLEASFQISELTCQVFSEFGLVGVIVIDLSRSPTAEEEMFRMVQLQSNQKYMVFTEQVTAIDVAHQFKSICCYLLLLGSEILQSQ